MKSITRLSLALMMFALFSISYLVTTVSADPRGNAGIQNKWGTQPQNAPNGSYNAPGGRDQQFRRQDNRNLPAHQMLGQQAIRGANSTLNYGQTQSNEPHTPDSSNEQGASGSSYHLNQPVNQGGLNGVLPPNSPR